MLCDQQTLIGMSISRQVDSRVKAANENQGRRRAATGLHLRRLLVDYECSLISSSATWTFSASATETAVEAPQS